MSWNVPDQPLSPPDMSLRQVSFSVTRVYTYDVELEGCDDDDAIEAACLEIANSEKGNFEEQIIEIEDVSPSVDGYYDEY
jgi:hypothetical protein